MSFNFQFEAANQISSLSAVIFAYVNNAVNRTLNESCILVGRISI